MSNPAINAPPVSPQLTNKEKRRAAARTAVESIAALAALFPAAFVAEGWQPHKPPQLGIHLDLMARGVLLRRECHLVLGRYCQRRAYQVALAAGGARIDLDGNPCGEVTAAEQQAASAVIARMDALAIERVATAKTARAAERASPKTHAKPPAKLQLVPAPADADPKQPSSLADLRRAAAERKQAGRNSR